MCLESSITELIIRQLPTCFEQYICSGLPHQAVLGVSVLQTTIQSCCSLPIGQITSISSSVHAAQSSRTSCRICPTLWHCSSLQQLLTAQHHHPCQGELRRWTRQPHWYVVDIMAGGWVPVAAWSGPGSVLFPSLPYPMPAGDTWLPRTGADNLEHPDLGRGN